MVSEKMIFEGSLSLKARDIETTLVCKSPSATDKDSNVSDRATSGNGDRLGTSNQNVISSSEKGSIYQNVNSSREKVSEDQNINSSKVSEDQNINSSREKGSADQNVNPSEEKARTGRTDQNINSSRDKRSTENIGQYVDSYRENGSTDLNINYSLEKGSADKIFNLSMQQASTNQNFNTSSAIRSTDQNINYSVNKGSTDGNVNSSIDKGSTDQSVDSSRQQGGRYQAALRLQKVYKSFRTRRQLADCAILVEQRWWKVLDFAELKRSSISFFDIEKPETAVSRWARARTRAAKVGKGLSKDKKARKLALQHWLEAIDPRHRYGHNLHYYYAKWLHCDSKQPFFYWLDVGDGREISHETCPRSKLQTQCIKYLGPAERMAYEVVMDGGKFRYKESGILLDTTKGPKETKWIFVLSVSKDLYVGQKSKGTFQHSSFLAGGATLSAGRLVVENGILKSVWPHSGHYLPTEENFQEFMSFLKEHNVDLTNVQKSPGEDDEEAGFSKKSSNIGIRKSPQNNAGSSKDSGTMNAEDTGIMSTDLRKEDTNSEENPPLMSRLPEGFCSKIAKLEIPQKDNALDIFKEQLPLTCREHFPDSDSDTEDGYETAEESLLTEEHFMVAKMNLFDEDQFEENEKPISKEKIMKRIDSHKGMKSYQLGQHLTSRWTTGAGPRIGCMRDYPAELQFRVLQQANLSPRQVARNSRIPAPSLFRESNAAVSLVAPSSSNRHFTVG